jgi:hypothetical protein
MAMSIRLLSLTVLLALPGAFLLADDEWGSLKGTFVYDGEIPEPRVLTTPRVAVTVPDESLVVGTMGGVKSIVVYLRRSGDGRELPIHPSYAAGEDAEVELTCNAFRFAPHVVLLRTSQTLALRNLETSGHNVRIDALKNPPHNLLVPSKEEARLAFRRPEEMPVPLSSSIHPWMRGYLIVQDHPYMALTNDKGSFTIRDLPAGEWTFQFWHEKAGYLHQVTQDGEVKEWPKGRLTTTIAPGENNLGTLSLAPRIFSD